MSCDKILQHDWTAPYCVGGCGLCVQFTGPFPFLCGSGSGFSLVPRPVVQCVHHTEGLGTRLVWLVRLTCKADLLLQEREGFGGEQCTQVVFYWNAISGMVYS